MTVATVGIANEANHYKGIYIDEACLTRHVCNSKTEQYLNCGIF